ncbi:MAG: hypothetical protein NVS1B10_04910 [Candidatus Saccharimonadales bacterium]
MSEKAPSNNLRGEGFNSTPPFLIGVTAFGSMSGAIMTYKNYREASIPKTTKSNIAVANSPYHETLLNQAEGVGAIFASPLIGVIAASAVTASLMRTKTYLRSNKARPVSKQTSVVPIQQADSQQ